MAINFNDTIGLGSLFIGTVFGVPVWLTYRNSRKGAKRRQQDQNTMQMIKEALDEQKEKVEKAANQITPSNGKTIASYIEDNHTLVAESRELIEQTQASVHSLIAQVDNLAGDVQEVQRSQFQFGRQLGMHLRESDDARERLNLPPERRVE